ncbi:MAG: acylphosphatase [Bryobacterales bacterium]|nr:acylphosphatase [Bryobacterales bacterium]
MELTSSLANWSYLPEMQRKIAKRWFVSGMVQGVGFRAFAQHKAASLGVGGWARNLEDGRVEVYAVGTPDRLDDLFAALHVGPRMARVRGVEEKDASLENLSGFGVR